MKHMNKLFSILLAVMMVMALTAPAWADDTSAGESTATVKKPEAIGTITIDHAPENAEYKIYKMFDLLEYQHDGAYSYIIETDSPWVSFIEKATFNYQGNETCYFETYSENAPEGYCYVRLTTVTDIEGVKSPIALSDWEKAELAQKAIAFVHEYNTDESNTTKIEPVETLKNDSTDPNNPETNWYKATGLDLGYYVIESNVGVLCALTTTDTDSLIKAKNTIPTIVKKVQEDSQVDNASNGYGDWNTAQIGDTVNFVSTITIPSGSQDYSVHDAMDAGLTLNIPETDAELNAKDETTNYVFVVTLHTQNLLGNTDVANADNVRVKGAVIDATDFDDDQDLYDAVAALNTDITTASAFSLDDHYAFGIVFGYDRSDSQNPHNHCDFEILFTQEFLDFLTYKMETTTIPESTTKFSNMSLTIRYSAVVNENAPVNTQINNTTRVRYGDDLWTEADITATYTYDFDIIKTDENDNLLNGAKFQLIAPDGESVVKLVELELGKKYRVATQDEIDAYNSNTVGASKVVEDFPVTYFTKIMGLDSDEEFVSESATGYNYYLKETKAPEGYNGLTELVKLPHIHKIGDMAVQEKVEGSVITWKYISGGVEIENKAGTLLPETGGIGTTIFYIAGSIMVVGAFVLLITKKRMNNNA